MDFPQISRRDIAAERAAFWADKAANCAPSGKPGKLELAAMAAAGEVSAMQAAWNARYMAARKPLVLIMGGK